MLKRWSCSRQKTETISSSSVFLPVDETGLPKSLLKSVAQTEKLRLEIMVEFEKKLCKVAKILKWKDRRQVHGGSGQHKRLTFLYWTALQYV